MDELEKIPNKFTFEDKNYSGFHFLMALSVVPHSFKSDEFRTVQHATHFGNSGVLPADSLNPVTAASLSQRRRRRL